MSCLITTISQLYFSLSVVTSQMMEPPLFQHPSHWWTRAMTFSKCSMPYSSTVNSSTNSLLAFWKKKSFSINNVSRDQVFNRLLAIPCYSFASLVIWFQAKSHSWKTGRCHCVPLPVNSGSKAGKKSKSTTLWTSWNCITLQFKRDSFQLFSKLCHLCDSHAMLSSF